MTRDLAGCSFATIVVGRKLNSHILHIRHPGDRQVHRTHFATFDRGDELGLPGDEASAVLGVDGHDQVAPDSACAEIELAIDLAQAGRARALIHPFKETTDGFTDDRRGGLAGGAAGERGGGGLEQSASWNGQEEVAVEPLCDEHREQVAGMVGNEFINSDAPLDAGAAGGEGRSARVGDHRAEVFRKRLCAPEFVKRRGVGAGADFALVDRRGSLARASGASQAVEISERHGDGLQPNDGGDGGLPARTLGGLGQGERRLGEGRPVGEQAGPGEIGERVGHGRA